MTALQSGLMLGQNNTLGMFYQGKYQFQGVRSAVGPPVQMLPGFAFVLGILGGSFVALRLIVLNELLDVYFLLLHRSEFYVRTARLKR